jgi:hypothetical protein
MPADEPQEVSDARLSCRGTVQPQPDGSPVVRHLPLQAGEVVEVIILVRSPLTATTGSYPLHSAPITYRDPTEPIAESLGSNLPSF